jgi:hypothetical protein
MQKNLGQEFDSFSGKEKVAPWSIFSIFLFNFPFPMGSEAIPYAFYIKLTVLSVLPDPRLSQQIG